MERKRSTCVRACHRAPCPPQKEKPMTIKENVSSHHGGFSADYFRTMDRVYDPSLDFSVNVNPWGPDEDFLKRLRQVDYRAYPDPQNLLVREAVAASDRKSTRLNSSHVAISYAVFCLK